MEKLKAEKQVNHDLTIENENIQRELEQLRINYTKNLNKTNFLRNSVNRSIEKDGQIINSINSMKSKYQTITKTIFKLKEVIISFI
jgi:hypothetical protein